MPTAAQVALWRNRDYLVLWNGQFISVLGSRISQISLPLLILALIRSPAQAGIVAALNGLPYLLFGLLAGVLIDRWDRKRTMLAYEAINAIATATIPLALWTGHLSMPQLDIVALVTGTAFVFFNVAEIAALPSIVASDQVPAAVSQNRATFSAVGVAGPAAGFLFQLARALPFLAGRRVVVRRLLLLPPGRPGTLRGGACYLASVLARRVVWEGMTWLWRHPSIHGLTLLTGLRLVWPSPASSFRSSAQT
ncbi:MAG: MFS transporter [Chloroflexota bacterium]|nr:MFS transporter [Chloroflexota bacterium]